MRILSFVNTLANSSGVNKRRPGRNAIGDSINYYRTLAPQLPDSFREMEPLFLAVICGCNAGLFREALHEVYIPRIQRGNAFFAAKVLGARGALLSVLVHFFEHGRWGSPVEKGARGTESYCGRSAFHPYAGGAVSIGYARIRCTGGANLLRARGALCHSLNRPLLLYSALMGQWRYSLVTDKLSATMRIAKRVYSLAQEQNDSALMIGAFGLWHPRSTYLGDFEAARQYAMRGVQIWRRGGTQSRSKSSTRPPSFV